MNVQKTRELRDRTRDFALRIVHLYARLPDNELARILGREALRSGTAVGAHYREAGRQRSAAERVACLEAGLRLLDETMFWIELLVCSRAVPGARLSEIAVEAEELVKLLVAHARVAQLQAQQAG